MPNLVPLHGLQKKNQRKTSKLKLKVFTDSILTGLNNITQTGVLSTFLCDYKSYSMELEVLNFSPFALL